jgi:hypothetical protein
MLYFSTWHHNGSSNSGGGAALISLGTATKLLANDQLLLNCIINVQKYEPQIFMVD